MEDRSKEPKQVIVMRADLGMRKGKIVSQGAHASIAFLTNKIRNIEDNLSLEFSEAEEKWLSNRFTKICLRVDSEEELEEIHQKAMAAGLISHLIVDAGFTEFNGVPTKTCLAIGPDYPDKINEITGHLKLL